MDTQIRFSVQGKDEIRSMFQELLRDSRTLSLSLDGSNRKFIEDLHEQISLLKERNKLILPTPSSITPPPNQGKGEEKDLNSKLSQLIDILQKDGLSLSEKTLSLLGKQPKSTPSQRSSEKESGSLSPFVRNYAVSTLLRGANSKDPVAFGLETTQNMGSSMMMMGGKAGIVGALGSLLAGLLLTRYNTFKEIAPSASRLSRVMGTSFTSSAEMAKRNPYDKYGIMAQDYLQGQASVTQSLGRYDQRNIDAYLKLGRAYNLSQGDLSNILRVGRGQRNFSLNNTVSSTIGSVVGSGLSEKEASIKIPEYLKILIELSQKQVSLLGRTNLQRNTQVIATLTKIFRNPDVIKSLVGGLDEGLRTSSSEQVEALQLQTLSRVKPGANLWELEKMKERGLMQDQYLPEMLKSLSNVSFNKEDLYRNISNIFFGGQKKDISQQIADTYLESEKTGRSFMSTDIRKITNLEDRATKVTDPVSVIEAEIQKAKLPENIKSMVENLSKIAGFIEDFNKDGVRAIIDPIANALTNSNEGIKKISEMAKSSSSSFGIGENTRNWMRY